VVDQYKPIGVVEYLLGTIIKKIMKE